PATGSRSHPKTVRRHPNVADANPSRAVELAARDAAIDSLRQQRQSSQLLQQARIWSLRPGRSVRCFCQRDRPDSEINSTPGLSRAQQRMREQINQVERAVQASLLGARDRTAQAREGPPRRGTTCWLGCGEGADAVAVLSWNSSASRAASWTAKSPGSARPSPTSAALSDRQRRVALSLIRDPRAALTSRLSALQSRCQQLEREAAAAEAAAAAELEAAAFGESSRRRAASSSGPRRRG
uniref:Kinesin motor domain-containing protein n=1 Tax=Macrostomum lignano TaxID=282301 RepID=A0A1I8FA37_9PLAT